VSQTGCHQFLEQRINIYLEWKISCFSGFYPDTLEKPNQDSLAINVHLQGKKDRLILSSYFVLLFVADRARDRVLAQQLSWLFLISINQRALFSVFDGHGTAGTECSKFAKQRVPLNFVKVV
jgi:serine/threonine protein phosphatase PrpC